MTGSVGYIVFLVIALMLVVLFFSVLDRILKGGATKKKTAEKKTETPAAAAKKPASSSSVETKTPPVMRIYNSELADDLDEMIKNSANTTQETRLKIENHMNKEKHIAEYIKSKNYHCFDFGDETISTDTEEAPMTFTREDYKKFMALSNIDEDKPL